MKKNLFVALLFLIPFCGFSQTTKPISGFLGVKFGSSKETVIAALKAKGAILDKANSHKDNLAFSNAKLGTRKATGLLVKFVNNKAFEADYFFDPEVEAHIINEYNELVADITRVYGEGNVTKKYMSPYDESADDGNKIVGMKLGEVDYHTLWSDSNKNTIKLSIETALMINLQYQDDVLVNEAIAKQNAKEKSDL